MPFFPSANKTAVFDSHLSELTNTFTDAVIHENRIEQTVEVHYECHRQHDKGMNALVGIRLVVLT